MTGTLQRFRLFARDNPTALADQSVGMSTYGSANFQAPTELGPDCDESNITNTGQPYASGSCATGRRRLVGFDLRLLRSISTEWLPALEGYRQLPFGLEKPRRPMGFVRDLNRYGTLPPTGTEPGRRVCDCNLLSTTAELSRVTVESQDQPLFGRSAT